jgi:hypothetical protein
MKEIKRCGDCYCKEGELHIAGCDNERCPFCGGQLISCDCVYKILNIQDFTKYTEETYYLSPNIYENGPTQEQNKEWKKILDMKGRIPYIRYPNICRKCGELWPDLFMVSDEEWKFYIEPSMRSSIICRECYNEIVRLVNVGQRKASGK